jgi:hypothetical protein
LATALCAIAAIPLALVAVVVGYTRMTGRATSMTWPAYAQFVVAVFGGYYVSAILATPVMFLARPARSGYLGRGIFVFVGLTVGLATLSAMLILLPGAGAFLSRGKPYDPHFSWVMIRIAPALGLFAAVFAGLQMRDESRRKRRQDAVT